MDRALPFCLLLLICLVFGCKDEEVAEPVIEQESFQRVENFNFMYSDVNVKNIQPIGDRLFYSHKTNPGFIDQSGEVIQLCCRMNNHSDMRQTFSEKFVVAASATLSGFSVYRPDGGKQGFLDFARLDAHQGKKTSINFRMDGRNFSLNGGHLIASIVEDNLDEIFIYDVEKHANFYGVPKETDGVIKVDFSAFMDPSPSSPQDTYILDVDAFKDGWIMSVSTNQTTGSGTYMVKKDGSLTKIDFYSNNNYRLRAYDSHTFMDNGQLFIMAERTLFVSRTGELKDLQPLIDFSEIRSNLRITSIGNRLVIYQPSFHSIYELISDEDAGEWEGRRLDDTNITFSNINKIAVFGEKVYVATSLGLFTKSLEGFWDSYEEPSIPESQSRTDEILWINAQSSNNQLIK